MKSPPSPECELPRLIRYVDPGAMPTPVTVSVFDPTTNILIVNRHVFGTLDAARRKRVLRTHKPSLIAYPDEGGGCPDVR